MPKRVLDGDGYWSSSKIRQLPFECRKDYAIWIPLAAANGVFEIDLESIKAKVYAAGIDPDMTAKEVYYILREFVAVGLVKVWKNGPKVLGYFIGIEKPGRLPGQRYIDRCPDLPPNPPPDDLSIDEMLIILESLILPSWSVLPRVPDWIKKTQ